MKASRSPVYLERPARKHQAEFLAAVRRSQALHRPWVYAPSTPRAYALFLERAKKPTQRSFLVREATSGALAGVATLGEIALGNLRSAYLGYYGFDPHGGKGYMLEGLSLVLDHAFDSLALHRVEANVQPGNVRSIRLVKRLGFRREGFSPRYLRIGGEWCDHLRYALLADEWRERR